MHGGETRDAIGQLALLGLSAAQIVKRTSIRRDPVNAAITVSGNEAARARMDEHGLTLDQAAIFSEFEDDPGADPPPRHGDSVCPKRRRPKRFSRFISGLLTPLDAVYEVTENA